MKKLPVSEDSLSDSQGKEIGKLQEDHGQQKNKFPTKDTAIEVVFQCKSIAEKYECHIKKFLDQLLEASDKSRVKYSVVEQDVIEDEVEVVFDVKEIATPISEDCQLPQQKPVYEIYDDLLESVEVGTELPNVGDKPQRITCFNCCGNHTLNDCPEERDESRIQSNRRDYMENSQNTVRYHGDDTKSFDNRAYRPGFVSDSLRQALDLRSDQLPLFIYRMRVLGYPPGWMKDAEIESSGLSIYDSNGNAVGNNNPSSTRKEYNGQRFIGYPGFNVPIPDGFVDEWEKLRMLPLQHHQQLSLALKHAHVTVSPEYKKRKLVNDFDSSAKKRKNADGEESELHPDTESSVSDKKQQKTPIVHGSPLIDTGNPYKRLPDSNKFAVGIADHLPFMNLPDSVGVFDKKMRGVLSGVREKMNKL